MSFRFWLGTHQVDFLARTWVPLFVSHRRLMDRVRLPRARGPWALDSGGFSELSLYGEWRTSPAEYVAAVRRYRDEIGNLAWAAPQDWMVEDVMLAKTGKTLLEHQELTVRSYLTLKSLAPELPFIPVLQGWTVEDYCRCWQMYEAAGVHLEAQPIVGVGTMCRRQATKQARTILATLKACGLKLHGFGLKTLGLKQCVGFLESSDSLAWSFAAVKRRLRLPGHTHKNCGNCLDWALQWRGELLDSLGVGPGQASFSFLAEAAA